MIPAYNRPARLQGCVDALAKLNAPQGGFEAVVVDDGSDAPLADAINVPDGLTLRISRQDNAGPASARNRGVKEARGSWIAFTDDDCLPHPGWLTAFDQAAQEHGRALVGGHTHNALTRCAPAAASQLLIDYLHHYFNEATGSPSFFPSNNFCMAKADFQAIGGFDDGFPLAAGEDRDFCDRVMGHGIPLAYQPNAQIDHQHQMTTQGFWRQHYHYGRGACVYHNARAKRNSDEVQVEPLRFYTRLIAYPLRQGLSLKALHHSALLFISQVANAAGYARERFGPKRGATKTG